MDVRRLKFAAALALFLVWVAGLAVMAVCSARRPPDRSRVVTPR